MVKKRWGRPAVTTFPAQVIDEDATGVWLRTDRGAIHRDERSNVIYVATEPWLGLVPAGELWVGFWGAANSKIDLCLPPVVRDETIEFCDLEIDVVSNPYSGGVRIVDRDEFEALDLPADLAARTEATAGDVQRRMIAGDAPFDAALDARRAAVVDRDSGHWLRSGWVSPYIGWERSQIETRFGVEGRDAIARHEAGDALVLVGGAGEEIGVLVVVDDDVHVIAADREGVDGLVDVVVGAGRELLRER